MYRTDFLFTLFSPQNLGVSYTQNTLYRGLNEKFFKFLLLKTRVRLIHGYVLYTSKYGITAVPTTGTLLSMRLDSSNIR